MIKVLKFGGTSVGSSNSIKNVAKIATNEGAKIVVLSAMSGTTDTLVALGHELTNNQTDDTTVHHHINFLIDKYSKCIDELFHNPENKKTAHSALDDSMKFILNIHKKESLDVQNRAKVCRAIESQGELLTTEIFNLYLREQNIKSELLYAFDFMQKSSNGTVNNNKITDYFKDKNLSNDTIYVTQGFICHDHNGEVDNLGRGGSDYSAALIGSAINADEVQIWTDIDGIHNNDPRYVENTKPIREISFDDAAELAYFGAKILHPSTIQPCKDRSIAVRLKNTMSPTCEGTLISDKQSCNEKFLAVAAKDNITVIRITSTRMLMAYGFLRKVFEVFEKYSTPIDMITTSEVAVALTIDDTSHLPHIINELTDCGSVEIEENNSIVCVVGNMDFKKTGRIKSVLEHIATIPVKMLSYGASNRNISLLVSSTDKINTLNFINKIVTNNDR